MASAHCCLRAGDFAGRRLGAESLRGEEPEEEQEQEEGTQEAGPWGRARRAEEDRERPLLPGPLRCCPSAARGVLGCPLRAPCGQRGQHRSSASAGRCRRPWPRPPEWPSQGQGTGAARRVGPGEGGVTVPSLQNWRVRFTPLPCWERAGPNPEATSSPLCSPTGSPGPAPLPNGSAPRFPFPVGDPPEAPLLPAPPGKQREASAPAQAHRGAWLGHPPQGCLSQHPREEQAPQRSCRH